MKLMSVLCCMFFGSAGLAQPPDFSQIVDDHIVAGFQTLAETSLVLAEAAKSDCTATDPRLRMAYHTAFDAWIGVSHLRFGPSEANDRAFALAFWPDTRGATPKALHALIRVQDPAVVAPEEFASVSIAARGFYALELLLYDPVFAGPGAADYHCALVQAITRDISANALAILSDWQGVYGDEMRTPGAGDIYRTRAEVARQLFTSLTTGLQFTSETRLGRPMGTFDRPRPNRAEARRSKRSLRHIVLSLRATRDLSRRLSSGDPQIDASFAQALDRAKALNDPMLAGVSDPVERFRIEALRQSVDNIRTRIAAILGPDLGVAAGFNSQDGD